MYTISTMYFNDLKPIKRHGDKDKPFEQVCITQYLYEPFQMYLYILKNVQIQCYLIKLTKLFNFTAFSMTNLLTPMALTHFDAEKDYCEMLSPSTTRVAAISK